MSLQFPLLLLLALIIPLLIWLRYYRRRPTVTYSNVARFKNLPRSPAVRLQFILPLLYGLGLLLLIVALARPRRGLEESKVNTQAVDICMLMDTSTSMLALDFATRDAPNRNRLDAAKDVMKEFIDNRPDDRISVIAYAAQPYTLGPLTLDHDWVWSRCKETRCGMLEDGTAIGDAISSGINRLRKSEAESKIMVLLTDGVSNSGKTTPVQAAQAAKAFDIKIYTVGAAKEGIVPYPQTDLFGNKVIRRVNSQVDEATLKRVSEITDGLFFRAENMDELRKVYKEIDAMEKTEIEVEIFTHYEERFMPWLIAGLAFLLTEKLLTSTRMGRLG